MPRAFFPSLHAPEAAQRWGLAAGRLVALGGGVSLTIVGIVLKIVPFLVWHRVYAPRVGRMPLPSVGELSWSRAERVGCALLTTGTVALAVAGGAGDARWIRAAGLVLTAGALAFAAALSTSLRLLAARGRAPEAAGPRVTLEERHA
jgi:hypothetical protein